MQRKNDLQLIIPCTFSFGYYPDCVEVVLPEYGNCVHVMQLQMGVQLQCLYFTSPMQSHVPCMHAMTWYADMPAPLIMQPSSYLVQYCTWPCQCGTCLLFMVEHRQFSHAT